MNFPYIHRQNYVTMFVYFFAGVRVGHNTAQTGPYVALPWRDLYDTSPQFLLTQGRVGLLWSPKYVGCIGEDELNEEEDDDEEPNA